MSPQESSLIWPERWQPEAVEAATGYVDSDTPVEIVVGDPATSVDGSVLAGFLHPNENREVMVIHDHSGREDVYPWRLLAGPVLRMSAMQRGNKPQIIFSHPEWNPGRPSR